ncbi:MAG: type II toxin-antitoxin system RelE/ParE family toxin [Bacteroidetes bacterium]|nr:type II toxin-antitoxin system RelE/ParE family toxin [Bacteroidota bacterium]
MIAGFADQTTADIYDGLDTKAARRIPRTIWSVAQRKLDMIEAAHELNDLRVPPGNKLETLRGHMSGYHSIRINDQFRLVFKWADGLANHVLITDYH